MPNDFFPTPATLPENFEVAFNFWYFTDKTGFVRRLAARAYALGGTYAEKLALLARLSSTDFMAAKMQSVPSNFSHGFHGGVVNGVIHIDTLHENVPAVFKTLINDLEGEFPIALRSRKGQRESIRLEVPSVFAHVLTAVYEDEDGSLTAQVSP